MSHIACSIFRTRTSHVVTGSMRRGHLRHLVRVLPAYVPVTELYVVSRLQTLPSKLCFARLPKVVSRQVLVRVVSPWSAALAIRNALSVWVGVLESSFFL